jgi:hypothetical protein
VLGRRLWLTVGVVVLVAGIGTANAQACSCAEIAPRKALRQADAALVAELLDVRPRGATVADYLYEVRRVYKTGRRIGVRISVRSAAHGATCGLPPRVGGRYGLLLHWAGGRWRGGLCGLMAPEDLRAAARCDS